MKLEEQRGLHRMREFRIPVDSIHLYFIQQLDASDGDTRLDGGDHGVDGTLNAPEAADCGGHRFRKPVETHRDFGDDAQRAFGADEQPGEVVACGRLTRAPAGVYDLSIRQHDREGKHVLAHGAIPHRIRAGCSRRRHSTNRGVSPGIDREEQTGATQMVVQFFARHTGLDNCIEVLLVHPEDLVHPREVDANSTAQRHDVALDGGACPERNDRNTRFPADSYDGRDFLG